MIRKVFFVKTLMDVPYSGAPISVLFLESAIDKAVMSNLAEELGHGGTVFALNHGNTWLLRHFATNTEISVGPKAFLSTAHLIYDLGLTPKNEAVTFMSREGEIIASYVTGGSISLNLPVQTMAKQDLARSESWGGLVNIKPTDIAWAALTETRIAILAVEGLGLLKMAVPDYQRIIKTQIAGLALTAHSENKDCDYYVRSFMPAIGILEEEASDIIHLSLAPQWARILQKKQLVSRQVSRRGSLIGLDVSSPGRVIINGRNQTVLKSDLVLELDSESEI